MAPKAASSWYAMSASTLRSIVNPATLRPAISLLYDRPCTRAAALRQGLADKKDLTAELEGQLKQALNDFKASGWQK